MTEHVVPFEGHTAGIVVLHGRADTIRATGPVVLSLDSIGFGRLNVAWRRAPCPECPACEALGSQSATDPGHGACGTLPHCGACGHHACPRSGA